MDKKHICLSPAWPRTGRPTCTIHVAHRTGHRMSCHRILPCYLLCFATTAAPAYGRFVYPLRLETARIGRASVFAVLAALRSSAAASA